MTACRYIPQEILNDDFSALDKANIFMLGASLYELATGTQLPTGVPRKHALIRHKLSLYGEGMQTLEVVQDTAFPHVHQQACKGSVHRHRAAAIVVYTRLEAAQDSKKTSVGMLIQQGLSAVERSCITSCSCRHLPACRT